MRTNRHIIDSRQFKEREVLERLFELSDDMKAYKYFELEGGQYEKLLLSSEPRKKILCTLFYEPSTRTRFSFESAMKLIGGDFINTESAGHFSSAAKGESIPDAITVIGNYVDAIVMRHPKRGNARLAAEHSPVPIINAGDGDGQHPTQTLLDIYTINEELGRIDDLEVGMVGDLLKGRTVHSLAYLLAHQKNIKLYFVSPGMIRMPPDIIKYLERKNIPVEETADLKKVAKRVDVLYVTRIQKERLRPEDYEKVKGVYVVDGEMADSMKKDSIIMHPLPRVDEILTEVDEHSRAAYFRQAENGQYVRMALLKTILEPDKYWSEFFSRPIPKK
ncbi:MAG: aspartate carbamoyltransferase [Candidatus Aenigmarchaeota archaeon]|nr:aspartate carbamoyltransferase [Candidatus Aenigmarchaeota archaeon]NIQ18017.1 aspartate carbamoyltransferase [Candidatus Aenigmarchaeota archaeon]